MGNYAMFPFAQVVPQQKKSNRSERHTRIGRTTSGIPWL